MDLFSLVARLRLDSSEYEDEMKKKSGDISSFSSKWKKAGVVAAAAIGAATVAVGTLTKSAVQSYAEYEQLAGGVKKLYGDASDELMNYANNAYKTAGMSANKYMEQATSFSAALVNSLGGDTSAAAKQTDVAMRAISDNFNTFGGDISNVQNAFQGFAKQNYTMLDNLKLGYGGTKTEMERLIADANEYAESIGMAGNLSIESFSDIVTAIDLVQQKQGIAGATAKEAATTIEGSLNMTKAAWENLITSLANPDADVGKAMDNLITAIVGDKSGEGLLNQIIPAIQRAVEGIGQFIQAAVPMLAQQLPTLIQSFLPVIVESVITLVTSLIEALPDIITTLVDLMPKLVELVIKGITDAVAKSIPILVRQGPRIIKALASGLLKTASTVISAGKKLINTLDDALYGAISSLAQRVINYAKQIPEKIKSGLGSLYNAGVSLIQGLWNGIMAKFNALIEAIKAKAAALPAAVKKIFGINSPSKVFMEIGTHIPEGLALGIERNLGQVQDAADAMSDATAFTPLVADTSSSTKTRSGNIIINLNYNASDDANDMVRDLTRGVQRYRMAGAI